MISRSELRDRYRRTIDRVAEVAERHRRAPDGIHVVAVTKYASPMQIRQIIELGHLDLGESRVQQLQQRVAMIEEYLARHRMLDTGRSDPLPQHVRWHMIGHIQRNKVKPLLPLVRLVHGVDSLRLAEELQARASQDDRVVDVLLQVNASGEAQKHGLAPPAVPHMVEQMQTMMHLKLRGLMTMAPYADDPEASRPTFERTAELFADLKSVGTIGDDFNILSMGMTNDFEVAIACGANILRLGRAIFGEHDERA